MFNSFFINFYFHNLRNKKGQLKESGEILGDGHRKWDGKERRAPAWPAIGVDKGKALIKWIQLGLRFGHLKGTSH
jgi:hypothetical protein